jgi:signal transduction histidine kinase
VARTGQIRSRKRGDVSGRSHIVTGRLKLRGKLTVLFLTLSLIPLSAISYVTYRQGEQRVRSNITAHLKSIAEKDAELVSSFIDERQADLKVLSETALLGDRMEAENLTVLMRAMRKEYKVYERLFIIDRQGSIVATEGEEGEAYSEGDIAASAWFRKAAGGSDYISDVFLSGIDPKPLFIISTGIKDSQGSLRGVAAASIDFSTMAGILEKMELGKTGEAYLINKSGYFLTRSRLGGRILKDRIPSGQAHIYLGKSGISEHVDYRGKTVLSALQWVPNRQWMLVAEQDSDEAFGRVYSFRLISIIACTILGVVVIAIAFLVSGRIERTLKKSYNEVLDLKKYSEDVIDSMPVSVLILGKDLQVMQVNKDFRERFGMAERDVNGTFLSTILPDRKLAGKIFEAGDGSMPVELYEIEGHFGASGKRILNVRAVPAQLEGNAHILLTIVDVTEKKVLEEQMQHAEKLRSLGTLTAGVAHELNTPLGNILLNAQMLIEDLGDKDGAHVEMLRLIESQAKQGSTIVKGLLEFSRQSRLSVEAADVNEILADLLKITESKLRLSNIELVKTFDGSIPNLRTDIGKLQQVFINIISNAVWAMPGGGKLAITTAFDVKTGKITAEFSDTGCGIPNENLGKIFDPFFSTREAGKGTGLGLAISYGIVKGMNGDIQVKSIAAGDGSRQSSGTTVTVSLPVPDRVPS